MKRLIFALIMALFFFVLLNIVYYNLDATTFGYEISFKFKIPYILELESYPIPVGFLLLMTFCLGMITIALLEALPSFYKSLELRSKNKKIRQLERELKLVRQIAGADAEIKVKEGKPAEVTDRDAII